MLGSTWILLSTLALAAPGLERGTLLTYRGHMTGVKGEVAETRKLFEIAALAAESDDGGTTLFWTLEERGRGEFAWPDRLGRWQFDARGKSPADTGPALLYDRGDGLSVVPLHTLLLAAEKPLSKGLSWSEGRFEYQVAGEEKAAGRDCWRVEVRNQYGPKRVLWVEKSRPLIAALTETVFIGQGQQFDVRLELGEEKALEGAQLDNALAGFESLLKLRDRLARAPRTERGVWNDDQLKILKAELAVDPKAVPEGPLALVFKAALTDINDQKGRSSAVAALRDQIVGKKIEKLPLEDLSAKPFSLADIKTPVTVLHFWEYKDSPLEEPYGQTGYLDFLFRQKNSAGVQVYGVAVDDRFADPEKRRTALSGVKKFQSFMNLSYPLLLDSGVALKQFGDPRPAGGKLPLFVVLDSSGKVLLYHVGYFEVKRDRGLEELETAVTKALDTAK